MEYSLYIYLYGQYARSMLGYLPITYFDYQISQSSPIHYVTVHE